MKRINDSDKKHIERLARSVAEDIGRPVEIEYNNPGGYDIVIWIGSGDRSTRCCLTCDSYTDAWNQLMTIGAVAGWLKEQK